MKFRLEYVCVCVRVHVCIGTDLAVNKGMALEGASGRSVL